MKIYKTRGSKDRLFEMIEKVNKVKINEDINTGIDVNGILTTGFQALKNGELSIQGGGSNNTTIQMTDDESIVQINGVDDNKNNYQFIFKVNYDEADQDGTYNIKTVELKKFSFKNGDGTQTFELNENDLTNFNSQNSNELYDVVSKFVDVKSPELQSDELAEAIQMIDAMKKDSYPYGGGSDRMQTGKGYADEKPVNPELRTKSPELEKYIAEELSDIRNEYPAKPKGILSTKSPLESLSPEKKALILKAIDNIIVKMGRPQYHPNVHEIQAEINKLENQNVNEIETDQYPTRTKPRTNNKQIPDISPDKQAIIRQAISNLRNRGEETTIDSIQNEVERLKKEKTNNINNSKKQNKSLTYKVGQFYEGKGIYQGSYMIKGEKYDIFEKQDNDPSGEKYYKEKISTGMNEGDYPDTIGKEFSPEKNYPSEKKKNKTKKVKLGEEDEIENDEIPTGVEINNDSEESDVDKVQQLAKEKEEVGELIPGGDGENNSTLEFDPEQILMGLKVEMEHTNDPMFAIEIVIDHLSTNKKYYTVKDSPNDSAQYNAAMDAEENQEGMPGELDRNEDPIPAIEPDFSKMGFDDDKDKQMTDMLLGFEPKNVGDEVENDEIQEDSSTSTLPQDQQKYLEYRKAGFDNLDDNQREELFNLWKKFRGVK